MSEKRKRPAKDGGPDFERLGDLLGEVEPLRPPVVEGRGRADVGRSVAEAWVEAVGAEIAENAQPLRIAGGRLVVATSSSAWAQTLQFMGEEVRTRLNGLLEEEAVKEVVFRHAGWEGRSRVSQALAGADSSSEVGGTAGRVGGPPVGLTEEQRRCLEEVEGLDLAPTIKEKILRAMEESFVRAEQDKGR